MATNIQRGQAIGNALINGTATLAQLDRLGRALAYREAQLQTYENSDNDGKASIFIEAFRSFCIRALKDYESLAAEQAAKEAAASKVETDFPQAP